MKRIDLTDKEFSYIINRGIKVGEGTDGMCILYKGKIFKIYHSAFESAVDLHDDTSAFTESDSIKIYKRETRIGRRSTSGLINYYDKDGTKLTLVNAINGIDEKRKSIKGSNLPEGVIYINGNPKGFIYTYYPMTKSIYFASILPLKWRLAISSQLIDKVEELVQNNVYPCDLTAFNDNHIFKKSGSNVLLSLISFKPKIIDLDGKSAIYTDSYNKKLENNTAHSITTLVTSLLSGEVITELIQSENIDDIYNIYKKLGISSFFDKYIDSSLTMTDVDEIRRILKQ